MQADALRLFLQSANFSVAGHGTSGGFVLYGLDSDFVVSLAEAAVEPVRTHMAEGHAAAAGKVVAELDTIEKYAGVAAEALEFDVFILLYAADLCRKCDGSIGLQIVGESGHAALVVLEAVSGGLGFQPVVAAAENVVILLRHAVQLCFVHTEAAQVDCFLHRKELLGIEAGGVAVSHADDAAVFDAQIDVFLSDGTEKSVFIHGGQLIDGNVRAAVGRKRAGAGDDRRFRAGAQLASQNLTVVFGLGAQHARFEGNTGASKRSTLRVSSSRPLRLSLISLQLVNAQISTISPAMWFQ